MLPDRVSNPGPLNYESGALPIALHGPAPEKWEYICILGICASTHMPSPGLSADIRRIHLSEREKL